MSENNSFALRESIVPAVAAAKKVQAADPNQKLEVSVYVRPNPTSARERESRLKRLNTSLPKDRAYLTGAEHDRVFGAQAADLDAVTKWAAGAGLRVVEASAPMCRVILEGTVPQLEQAFGVKLSVFEHPELGRFRSYEGEVVLPEQLHGIVTGVFGLGDRPLGRPHRRSRNAVPVPVNHVLSRVATNPFPGSFFPPVVAELYNYPSNFDGSGVNVAILAFNGLLPDGHGGYKLDALTTYFENVLGGKTPKITDVSVNGHTNLPGADTEASARRNDTTGEVMLDMCVMGSVAPGANIFMYFTGFTERGWVDAIQQAINDGNNISVISISYGNPESGVGTAWTKMAVRVVNQAFQAAAAKGITVFCSSGDDGSSDGLSVAHVDFPASSPFVTGVGGTRLFAAPAQNPTHVTAEVVWNGMAQEDGATGGGISATFPKPSYQSSVNVPPSVVAPHFIGRGVPDVCAVADPRSGVIVINVNGQDLEAIGGTSASAPLWAALVARLNQALGAPCGFLNPFLYTRCISGVLNDITVGNNGAYQAAVGWDPCTGLGSPDGGNLLAALRGAASPSARMARALSRAFVGRAARTLRGMPVHRAVRVLRAMRAQRPARYHAVMARIWRLFPARASQVERRLAER